MIDSLKHIREEIIKISHHTGHGHIPTCFSVLELIYAVYSKLQHDSNNPDMESRDIFILSKGHASLAHYCILSLNGYFATNDLYTFGAYGTKYGCHSDRTKIPGVEASTGSLGHGIGIAVGAALAYKIKQKDNKVYVLIGDGEANEGSVWEALLVAQNEELDNLTILFDNNQSHARGLQIKNPVEKFKAFDCSVFSVNGHDIKEIEQAIDTKSKSVKVIIGNTTKGYGCKTLIEETYSWHRRSPNSDELSMLVEELNEKTV